MSEPFIGEIRLFGFNFAPRAWAFCDGTLLPINQNSALFSLLGTTYGGDGRTTFALPDLRGRAAIKFGNGPGLSNYSIGQNGGTEQTTLAPANMPSHNHTLHGETALTDSNNPQDRMLASNVDTSMYASPAPANDRTMASQSIGNTGGGQAFNNLSPYLAVNFCIALQGLFPSRN